MNGSLCAYWLSITDGIGNASARSLLEYAGSYEEIWELTPGELASPALKLPPSAVSALKKERNEDEIQKSYENMLASGISFYHDRHPAFPGKLKDIYNPPSWIYVKGKLPDPGKLSVAIVGARNCSEYGRYVTRKISKALGDAGISVISGMARGIDGIAQKAVLESGGYSCGVLGCGVDICYPPENKDIYDFLLSSGGLISEYRPGTKPVSGQFPMRNRIISGLSDVVIIIEARERSGSLITADMALEQGKDVYALPGRVTDALSHGCNRLIKQGAGIILSPEEFITDMITDRLLVQNTLEDPVTEAVPAEEGLTKARQMTLTALYDLTESEQKIMSVMDFYPKSVKKLQDETSLDPASLYAALTGLTLKGLTGQNGNHYYLSGK
ncbi:MAG: DNA-processing protein DprA [Lachnospiraceae bacterium]|nr:DNA-processing protein DprA [Lachnospiraceae bacterium]